MINTSSTTGSVPVEFEYVTCDQCGSDDTSSIFEGDDYLKCRTDKFRIVKCNNCSLVYLNPRPTQQTISCFYPEGYLPFTDKKNGIADRVKSVLIKNDVRRIKKNINRQNLKILEIGCANGSYLSQLEKLGKFEVTGIELSPSTANYARNTYKLNVITGTIFDGNFQDCSFDVIIMRHVLEHVYNPSETIREIHRILKKDGIFFFIIPNIKSIEVAIFNKYWPGWDLPRHLYDFSPDSISLMLEKNGFQNIKISYQSIPNNWIRGIKNFYSDQKYKKISNIFFSLDNTFLLVSFFPISYVASLLHISGRISIIAKK